jgi:hypothetical protein
MMMMVMMVTLSHLWRELDEEDRALAAVALRDQMSRHARVLQRVSV